MIKNSEAGNTVVIYTYPLTILPFGLRCFGNRPHAAIVKANGDLVLMRTTRIFLYFVTGKSTAQRTDDGGNVASCSVADLMPEDAAKQGSGNCTEAATFTLLCNFTDAFDGAAIATRALFLATILSINTAIVNIADRRR